MKTTATSPLLFILAQRCLLLGLAVPAFLTGTWTDAAAYPALDEIRTAWKRNAEAITSIQIEWKAEVFKSKRAPMMGPPEEAQDIEYESSNRLIIVQDGRFRFDSSGVRWSTDEGHFVPFTSHQASTDKYLMSVRPSGGLEVPTASINPPSNLLGGLLDLKPVAMTTRTLDHHFPFIGPDNRIAVTARKKFRGRSCLTIKEFTPHGTGIIYVDEERAYLPLKWERRNDAGRLLASVDIEDVSEQPNGSWTPAGWKIVRNYGLDGQPTWTETCKVKSTTINEPIDDGVFQLKIPANAYVHDRIRNEK